jgi:DNA repair exonuclease SbcCD ATPase subunit
MIQFTKLRWKNFLSTGNQFTELALDKSPTTLVLGVNGSGKSTMLDALCYCLYKKPFRKINKPQIPNTINGGGAVVEVEFSIGTHTWKICRGIKPDYFQIFEDGNLEPRHQMAGQKDDQAYLEEDVLKTNYQSFTQVVILGNAKYTPFMQLEAKDRRKFIEEILDIGVFSTMNELLGARYKALKIQLETLNKDLATNEEKNKLVDGFIAKLEADRLKATTDTQKQIDEQNNLIDQLTPEINSLEDVIHELTEYVLAKTNELNKASKEKADALQAEYDARIESLEAQIEDTVVHDNELATRTKQKTMIESALNELRRDIQFYEKNDSCGTCKQNIVQGFKDEIVSKKRDMIKERVTAIEELEKKCEAARNSIRSIKEANAAITQKINEATTQNQKATRALMTEAQEEVKKVTADLQASIRAYQEGLQEKETKVNTARQLIKKMEADIKAAAASSSIEEQHKKKKAFEVEKVRLEKEKAESIELRHYYDVATVLLKDTGIKAAIIKQYLSTINRLVNKYLSDMDFFVSFMLDENFDETFKSRHRDALQYNSFSEGEKMRIDLALLFAWRDIAHMKNSCSTNLLILDEVIDSSLDHNGTDFFIKMLNELGQSTSQSSNVFVISHKNDAALDKFKDVIRFEKVKGFSRLVDDV